MRVGYSILREIHKKEFTPESKDYGIQEHEFLRMVKLLEKQGYLDKILVVGDFYSLKQTRITDKGIRFLKEHFDLETIYPAHRSDLVNWIQVDKTLYGNGADSD
ncbi:hypothetical protein [Paenibacillus lemnae]|uniref:Uncharacterized protein n=1 Tax=Paenibacillus lemnae TaxID=1330551 RepID=A0A848MA37_PAELE|nr:hypothetical protein [Paenibacillus lemnae]NMO97119.1 hypothetical protein [Paenibacillus lemnae]